MSESHPLDRAIDLEVVDDDVVRGRTQPEWANMVGPFGGVTAAAMLHAIELHPDRLGEPVALTVNFAAPIADGDFEISRRAPRTNRTNQHWIVELSQEGEVKTTATAVFGNHRDTWSDTEAVMPTVPSPDEIPHTNPDEPSDLGSDVRHAFCRRFVLRRQCRDRPVVGDRHCGCATPPSAGSTFPH